MRKVLLFATALCLSSAAMAQTSIESALDAQKGENTYKVESSEAKNTLWTQTHKNFQGMPWSISPQVVRDVTEFARIYTSQQNARQMLEARFGSTYWNYLLLRK